MQKQDGCEQVKGKVKSCLQETIILDKTVKDEETLWKKLLPNLLVTFYIYSDKIGKKINWRKAGYLFYLMSEKLN